MRQLNTQEKGLPLGFAMSLAQNAPALKYFGGLDQAQREQWVQKSRQVRSKPEMRQLVEQLAQQAEG